MKEANVRRISPKELEGQGKERYKKEINILESDFVHNLINIADKYNIDRDEAIELSVKAFVMMSMACTFKNYDAGSERHDNE